MQLKEHLAALRLGGSEDYSRIDNSVVDLTDEMIEAGAAIILTCYDMPGAINDGDRKKAVEVFTAMLEARAA